MEEGRHPQPMEEEDGARRPAQALCAAARELQSPPFGLHLGGRLSTSFHFTQDELGALEVLIRTGFARDPALRALIDAEWNPHGAMDILMRGEPTETWSESQEPSPEAHQETVTTAGSKSGVVTTWSDEEGYGFMMPDEEDGEDAPGRGSSSEGETRAGTTFNLSSMQVLCHDDTKTLCRPCVDCGLYTGRYCDFCQAESRLPNEVWARGQMTPLCSVCDNQRRRCHFCAGKAWVTPPPNGRPPESEEETLAKA